MPNARKKSAGKKIASAPTKKKSSGPAKKKAGRVPKPAAESEQLLSYKVVYEGPLFRVLHDKLIEPGGLRSSGSTHG